MVKNGHLFSHLFIRLSSQIKSGSPLSAFLLAAEEQPGACPTVPTEINVAMWLIATSLAHAECRLRNQKRLTASWPSGKPYTAVLTACLVDLAFQPVSIGYFGSRSAEGRANFETPGEAQRSERLRVSFESLGCIVDPAETTLSLQPGH